MTVGRLLMHVGWTLAFPGAGHGAAGRRAAAIAWAVAGLVGAVAITWTIWALFASLALRAAAAIDVAVRLRGVAREEEEKNLPLYASLVGVVGFVYFQFATERFAIPSDSMSPAIAIGDVVYVEKVTLAWSAPARGEVIVFEHPCEGRTHIKRVAAIAGDSIEIRCGVLYLGGTAVARAGDRETLGGHAYVIAGGGAARDFPGDVLRACPGRTNQPVGHVIQTRQGAAACEPQAQYVVPDDSVFVLGDNRGNANDSRNWGVVPLANVKGRAIGVAWPLGRVGAL